MNKFDKVHLLVNVIKELEKEITIISLTDNDMDAEYTLELRYEVREITKEIGLLLESTKHEVIESCFFCQDNVTVDYTTVDPVRYMGTYECSACK